MKKLPLLLLVGALAAPAALPAATFEGKVTMQMTGARGAPSQMVFSLKEGFSRVDVATGQGRNAAIIFDAAKQQVVILIPEQRMYMVQPMTKPATATATTAAESLVPQVEVTTTKEKILGYDCVKYVSTTKDGSSEIWVTDQLGSFMGMGAGGPIGGMGGRRGAGGPGGVPPQAWEQALLGKNVFPLRVVTTASGKETFRMEATAVDKASLPDATFAAPADYQDMGAVMRGIPGLPPGMKLPGSNR